MALPRCDPRKTRAGPPNGRHRNCPTRLNTSATAREIGLKVPLVVRMEGTNVEQGKKILADSKLDIITASDMLDGARKAVEASNR